MRWQDQRTLSKSGSLPKVWICSISFLVSAAPRAILTAEELDQLACLTDDAHEREIIQAVKELTSFQMEMSEEEYKQAEDAVYDRTVKESEEVDESLQNGEKPEDTPEMEEAEAVGPSLTNLSL